MSNKKSGEINETHIERESDITFESKSEPENAHTTDPVEQGKLGVESYEVPMEEDKNKDVAGKEPEEDTIMKESHHTPGSEQPIEANSKTKVASHSETTHQTPSLVGTHKTQISYKSKLLGEGESLTMEKDYELQMREWLEEEKSLAPLLSDSEKQIVDNLPTVDISDEKLKHLCLPWKDSLIITLLGRPTSLGMMKDRIGWLLKSNDFTLVDLPNNFYVFTTKNMEIKKRLLFDGPWLIQGHYLAVQRWSPNFDPYCSKVRKIAIWVRIPTLPIHCYSEDILLELGNLIGRTLKVDLNTLAHCNNQRNMVERGKFARVSVEIDLNKKLQSRFVVRSRVFTVEYEGLDTICFRCGKYGHGQEICPLNQPGSPPSSEKKDKARNHESQSRPEEQKPPATCSPPTETQERHSLVSVPGVSFSDEFGNWMKVSRPAKKKIVRSDTEDVTQTKLTGKGKSSGGQQKVVSGSRYDILNEEGSHSKTSGTKANNKNKEAEQEWRQKEQYVGSTSNTVFSAPEVIFQSKRTSDEAGLSRGVGSGGKQNDSNKGKDKKKAAKATKGGKHGPMPQELEASAQEGMEEHDGRTGLVLRSKKRAVITRPKLTSPNLKKKQIGRDHHVIIGSMQAGSKHVTNLFDIVEERGQQSYPPEKSQIENNSTSPTLETVVTSNNMTSQTLMEESPDRKIVQSEQPTVGEGAEQTDLWFEICDEGQFVDGNSDTSSLLGERSSV